VIQTQCVANALLAPTSGEGCVTFDVQRRMEGEVREEDERKVHKEDPDDLGEGERKY